MSRQFPQRVQPVLKKIQDALAARLPQTLLYRGDPEALEVWQEAGVVAWKSLRDEMRRDAESAGHTPMPRTDPSQGKLFLRVIDELGSERDPIGEIWEALSDWLLPNQDLNPIEKRLRYRQSLLAAGTLLNDPERAIHALRMEAESLGLKPVDSDWIEGWFD